MTNPFGSWQVGTLSPGAEIPVSMLVQSAVAGTVDDEITEHAHDLFAILEERGEAAWQEAAALLTQFVLSGGHYGTGDVAADRYLAQQPEPSPALPVLRRRALCWIPARTRRRTARRAVLQQERTAASLEQRQDGDRCFAGGRSRNTDHRGAVLRVRVVCLHFS